MYVWSDNLSVGVKEMDEQHQHLFAILNEIFECVAREPRDRDKNPHVLLDAVMDYNLYHLRCEEDYMREFGCLDLVHLGMHRWYERRMRSLFAKASDAVRRGDAGADRACIDLARFAGDWHLGHIEKTDKRYTQCFHDHGLAER